GCGSTLCGCQEDDRIRAASVSGVQTCALPIWSCIAWTSCTPSMPGMDGVQLVQAIHDRDESLPVILLTAHGSERVAVNAMKSGAYDYVTKPFDVEEFCVVVDRALEARTLRVQNRRLAAEKAPGQSILGH